MSDFSLRLKTALVRIGLGGAVLMGCARPVAAAEPLRLDPENPHYFLFRGKPTFIVTSGEHYGAVLNLDFDYAKYLSTLARDGLNGTRLFVGAYCEPEGAFKIARNTLAPRPCRFVCPWARSEYPEYENRGNKFDLDQWDKDYFERLRKFVALAGKHGIIVEINLFCPFYDEKMWRLSPMNPINNTSGIPPVASTNVYTLDKSGRLLAVQDALVRKIATELNGFDNLYYEICNEPYFGGVTLEWQRHIAGVLIETEKGLPYQHLISQNIANHMAKARGQHPGVSIFNFHYASPPETVALNYDLNKVIGDNETGFRGTNDAPYRMEAWDFMIAGGGLFNNLDYSFTVGHEDGSFVFPADQPGGGTPALRRQLRFLSDVLRRFDFVHMEAVADVVVGGVPEGMTARVLAKPGADYLVYLRPDARRQGRAAPLAFPKGQVVLGLALPREEFKAEWYDPRGGVAIGYEHLSPAEGLRKLEAPAFEGDLLLVIRRTGARPPAGPWEGILPIPASEDGSGKPAPAPAAPPAILVTTNWFYRAPAPQPSSSPPTQPSAGPPPAAAPPSRIAEPLATEAPRRTTSPERGAVVTTNRVDWAGERSQGRSTWTETGAGPAARSPAVRPTLGFPNSYPNPSVTTNVWIHTPAPSAPMRR